MSRRGSPRGKVTVNASPERYVITVDADELPLIAAALGRDLAPKRAPKPRAKAQSVELDPIDTGDPGLDDFMRRSRARGAKALGCPKPSRAVPKIKRLTIAQFEAEEKAWDEMAARHRTGTSDRAVAAYLEARSKHEGLLAALAAR